MLSLAKVAPIVQIQLWPIDRFVPYIRHLRRNAAAVDRMCASIREFGFKVPCLVDSSWPWPSSMIVPSTLWWAQRRPVNVHGVAEVPQDVECQAVLDLSRQ